MSKQIFANNSAGVLSGAHNSAVTTLNLVSTAAFPVPAGGDWFLATLFKVVNGEETNREIVSVIANNTGTNQLTVLRGKEGTTPSSYADGDRIELRLTALQMNQLSAETVIHNGGFENDLDLTGWTITTTGTATATLDTVTKYKGEQSLKLAADDGANEVIAVSDRFSLNPLLLTKYRFDCAVNAVGYNLWTYINLRTYNAVGTLVDTIAIHSAIFGTDGAWEPFTKNIGHLISFTAVEAEVEIKVSSFNGSIGKFVHIDNIDLGLFVKASDTFLRDVGGFYGANHDVEYALQLFGPESGSWVPELFAQYGGQVPTSFASGSYRKINGICYLTIWLSGIGDTAGLSGHLTIRNLPISIAHGNFSLTVGAGFTTQASPLNVIGLGSNDVIYLKKSTTTGLEYLDVADIQINAMMQIDGAGTV